MRASLLPTTIGNASPSTAPTFVSPTPVRLLSMDVDGVIDVEATTRPTSTERSEITMTRMDSTILGCLAFHGMADMVPDCIVCDVWPFFAGLMVAEFDDAGTETLDGEVIHGRADALCDLTDLM